MIAVYCSFYYTYKRIGRAQSTDRLDRRSIHTEVRGYKIVGKNTSSVCWSSTMVIFR